MTTIPLLIADPNPDAVGDWTASAVCASIGSSDFFPERGDSVPAARKACQRCPVRRRCLAEGLHEGYGVWGGLGERDRRGLRRDAKTHGWDADTTLTVGLERADAAVQRRGGVKAATAEDRSGTQPGAA